MQAIVLTSDRPALEVRRGDQVSRWEYDVLTLKLECERLEGIHQLREGGTLKPPTVPFLADFAAFLVTQGLDGCSIDVAYRVYSLVGVQFAKLAASISDQVAALSSLNP